MKNYFLGTVFIFSLFYTSSVCASLAENQLPTNWYIETRQVNPQTIEAASSTDEIYGDRWRQDTINNAYIGPNAWGFGSDFAGAGGASGLEDAFVKWSYLPSDQLQLKWFVGGYHRDYNGRPAHGWQSVMGGNNVKAYPRIGIGSASGQPYATSGSPSNVPIATTSGVRTVDQEKINLNIGLPARVRNLTDIDVHINLNFEGGSQDVDANNRYGNYFFAIDSYFHDVDDIHNLSHPSLKGSLNAINDSSGDILGTDMSSLPATTKKWAMMIWYHTPPFYETSGGQPLNNGNTVVIDGREFYVKYKVEVASQKKFKYVAFIMKRSTEELTAGGKQPIVRFKKFTDFLINGSFQELLNREGALEDIDGQYRIIKAPSASYVLSDINVGVEASTNPDTSLDTTPRPVAINFKELYFHVHGKGEFGFKSVTNKGEVPTNDNNHSSLDPEEMNPKVGAGTPALPLCTSNNGKGNLGRNGNYYNNNGTQCQSSSSTEVIIVDRDVTSNMGLPVCTSNNGKGNLGRNGNHYNNNGTQCQSMSSTEVTTVDRDVTSNVGLPVCISNSGKGNLGRNGNHYNNNGTQCQSSSI